MKKSGLMNSGIVSTVSMMGHGDFLAVCDAGLPIPDHVKRIDLAISQNYPDFISTLKAILDEMKVERAIIAEEMLNGNSEIYKQLKILLTGIPIEQVSHQRFKVYTKGCKAIVRTGECSPYANIILVSGVIF